jgi:hypothetical protein
MGYQGWFGCPNDGSRPNRWWHWFNDQSTPDPSNLTVDMWPDTSEFEAHELYQTNMNNSNGRPASLYSAYNVSVVDRHFNWMEYNNLDGIMLQRFVCELTDPAFRDFRDQVTMNVKVSAETHGRAFAIMYDITNSDPQSFTVTLKSDWIHLVDDLGIINSPAYLRHAGRPVLGIWGLGFDGSQYPGTVSQAQDLIAYFKNTAAAGQLVTLFGGVPYHWRTPLDSDSDSKRDQTWIDVYRSFHVVSPWSVGRYANVSDANSKVSRITQDLADLTNRGVDYMPVVFPGYSYKNKGRSPSHPLNEIVRDGGRFWWQQVYNAVSAGCTMIYCAMFDEVDEGTAMFKVVADQQDLPNTPPNSLVYLDIDGYSLPSDWYLHLADAGGRMLRGEIARTAFLPIEPGRRQ